MSTRIPTTAPDELGAQMGARIGAGIGFVIGAVFTVYIWTVFAVLWVYVWAAASTDGSLIADTWTWLIGLDAIPAVLTWLALLPIAIFVSAGQTGLGPWVMGLVMVALVAWTVLAFSGPLRYAWSRRASRRRPR